jgi:lipid II isoglutaminyl synthase (glutamine-hydrolysing)
MALTTRLRRQVAVLGMDVVNATSRVLRRGSGTVAGGHVALRIDPDLLRSLTAGREVALVSGTNGKTTTTALLAAALRTAREVATNDTGSNMTTGHVATAAHAAPNAVVVLEVDEAYLAKTAAWTTPRAVVLLNLSRDQLDRASEVRMVAEKWRTMCATTTATVVANADDPLIVYAASAASSVVWVAAGSSWNLDAVGCPSCGGHISFSDHDWTCGQCAFRRPRPSVECRSDAGDLEIAVEGEVLRHPFSLPGAFNRGNAALALAGASILGVAPTRAMAAFATVSSVAGRYSHEVVDGRSVSLLLAKNPAGWSSLFDVVASDDDPLVLSINARTADGADPSWLYDVPFEALRGRTVVATGDRRHDLSVRLHYAEVDHVVEADQRSAIARAAALGSAVTFIGNYTAFGAMVAEVRG